MEISKALADKLVRLARGERLPASSMRSKLVSELIIEGIIIDQRIGRSRSLLYVADVDALNGFLRNHFSIQDIESYVAVLKQGGFSRADLTRSSSDSKLVPVRTFKGFLINSFMPIHARLDDTEIIIHPIPGTFQFIHNYETFIPAPEVIVVNVENSENFSRIAQQQFLFQGLSVLFVSRYPQNQNKDLLKWLQKIPNNYLHYGDFDYAGINIYLNEYKQKLGERAKFFIPDNLELLLSSYGSKVLYDRQNLTVDVSEIKETGITDLIKLIQLYKKGLEQEVFIDLI